MLPDAHRPTGGVGHEDDAQVDRPDVGGVVVEQRERLECGLEVGIELLAPLPAQAAEQAVVARVQVATDPDRPAVVQALVGARPRPAHQEVAVAVTQDEVRDDLLVRRVVLHRVARRVPPVASDDLEERGQAGRPQPMPARRVRASVAGDRRGPARRSSGHRLQSFARGPQALRDLAGVGPTGALELRQPAVERR